MQNIRRNRFIRHLLFFVKNLFASDLTLYASSLSFYTIFSIIPLLLILLTLFTKLPNFHNYYDETKSIIMNNILPIHTITITDYIETFLANSNSLGVLGLLSILISSFLFFNSFTLIINTIFKQCNQGYFKNIFRYLLFIITTPIFLSLFFYISQKVHTAQFTPFLLMWLFFILLYTIGINKKIRKRALFISTLLTTSVITLSKELFIFYTFYNKMYETLYGSFSIALLFFLWIFIIWVIVIYGFKLAYLIDRLK